MTYGFYVISKDQYHNGLGRDNFKTIEEALEMARNYIRVLHSSRDESATYIIKEDLI